MIDIASQPQLEQLCAELKKQSFFCLDTEFIREKTYFPVLALIQIAWPGQEPVVLDPCCLDLAPFLEILQDPNILKVLHAGRQDIEIFYNLDTKKIGPVFDTQVAAALLGMGEQIGYSALVQRICQVALGKGSRFTDWLARPLLKEQLEYARDDVRYLSEVYNNLYSKLQKHNRLEWF